MAVKYGQARGASNHYLIREGLGDVGDPEGFPLYALASCPERLWQQKLKEDTEEESEYMETCWDKFQDWREYGTTDRRWFLKHHVGYYEEAMWKCFKRAQKAVLRKAKAFKNLWLSGMRMS
jgi:hypothetical protein